MDVGFANPTNMEIWFRSSLIIFRLTLPGQLEHLSATQDQCPRACQLIDWGNPA